jgi:hypothetical protein
VFERGLRAQLEELSTGQRIQIAGRNGTFVCYYKIRNFPQVIEWLPDGKLEFEVTIWTQGGVLVSSLDEQDALSPFEAWEAEFNG